MKEVELTYIGTDFLGTPAYQDKDGVIFKDINLDNGCLSLYSISGHDIDDDPCYPIESIPKYKDCNIIILGREDEPTKGEKRNYQLLCRLQMDCDYFLGYGNGYEKYLWANSVEGQIAKMKELWQFFEDEKKPRWLTMDQILDYETKMLALKKDLSEKGL